MSNGYITNGYRFIEDPRDPSDRVVYIQEHRYVMEKAIGRSLASDEVVHHINEDKLDNRLENLELMTLAEHTAHHNRTRVRKIKKVLCCDEGEPHYSKNMCRRCYQTNWRRRKAT